jgi:signal recognition particle subunit SRP54
VNGLAFEGLADKLSSAFKRLRSKGKLTEADIKEAMREVRLALLEADVNYKVVKNFIATVSERAVGQEVLQSVTPGQQIIKIVHDEMTGLMGGTENKLIVSPKPPTVLMTVGLQGAGKTTTVAKLAKSTIKQGRRPLLVACDIYRPAAIKQLQVLGDQIGVPVYSAGQSNPVNIALDSLDYARSNNRDLVIIDTAGRLHTQDHLMRELEKIFRVVGKQIPNAPHEVILVLDATTGQNALNQAKIFKEISKVTGIMLAKLDGTAKGGIVIAIHNQIDIPVKFIGLGETMEDIEPFDPDKFVDALLSNGNGNKEE